MRLLTISTLLYSHMIVELLYFNQGDIPKQGRAQSTVFWGLCLTSELCLTSAETDWTINSQTPREGDFGSEQDSNC